LHQIKQIAGFMYFPFPVNIYYFLLFFFVGMMKNFEKRCLWFRCTNQVFRLCFKLCCFILIQWQIQLFLIVTKILR